MPTLEVKDATYKLECTHASGTLTMYGSMWRRLMATTGHTLLSLACDKITVDKQAQVGDEIEYRYVIDLLDGRKWKQRIFVVPGNTNPPMTFDVSDKWTLNEFGVQRDFRTAVIDILAAHGECEIKVTRL